MCEAKTNCREASWPPVPKINGHLGLWVVGPIDEIAHTGTLEIFISPQHTASPAGSQSSDQELLFVGASSWPGLLCEPFHSSHDYRMSRNPPSLLPVTPETLLPGHHWPASIAIQVCSARLPSTRPCPPSYPGTGLSSCCSARGPNLAKARQKGLVQCLPSYASIAALSSVSICRLLFPFHIGSSPPCTSNDCEA